MTRYRAAPEAEPVTASGIIALLMGMLLFAAGGCAPATSSGGPGGGDSAVASRTGAVSAAVTGAAAEAQEAEYRLYVANESSDIISRVLFRPGMGAEVESEIAVGMMPTDSDGAHGITVSPDGEYFYVTLAHGTPYGYLWKFHAGPDTLAGRTTLGNFPASVGMTPDGAFVIVGNFNLHGEMEPSDVSFVYAPSMTEVSRITTCLMPHGSRVNVAGTRQYSTCMHSDQVVEIDLTTFEISSRFSVRPGGEGSLALDDRGMHRGAGAAGMDHAGMDRAGTTDHAETMDHAMDHAGMDPGMDRGMGATGVAMSEEAAESAEPATSEQPVCSPTWVEPGKAGRANRFVYVACNRTGEVLELDVSDWRVTRRFATGNGPYNLNTTANGRYLVATLKGDQGVSIIDLERGGEVARIATTQPITHGVTSSPDSRYAFVSNESVGATPGTMDVFDLERRERVASVQLRYQSGGIDFWRMSAPGTPGTPGPADSPPSR